VGFSQRVSGREGAEMHVSKNDLRIWDSKFDSDVCKSNVEEIIEAVRDDGELIFLPRRKGHLNVYYLGTVILDFDGKSFTFNRNYLKYLPQDVANRFPSDGKFPDFKSWRGKLADMKSAMESRNMSKREKRAQQNIVQAVNGNRDSEYCLLDMEYDYPGIRYGRFDMIAVSKERVNGKHKIAIIELKYGTKAFGGSAGIVEHARNLSRYIFGDADAIGEDTVHTRLSDLSSELASMSAVCNRFALPPAPYFPTLKAEDIDIGDIQTWLLCVACQNIKTAEEGILRHLGYPATDRENKATVRDAAPDLRLRYQIVQEEYLNSLNAGDFRDASPQG
jgi:hypothetical protein